MDIKQSSLCALASAICAHIAVLVKGLDRLDAVSSFCQPAAIHRWEDIFLVVLLVWVAGTVGYRFRGLTLSFSRAAISDAVDVEQAVPTRVPDTVDASRRVRKASKPVFE